MGNHYFFEFKNRGDKLRLFIAINFENDIKNTLSNIVKEIEKSATQGKFVVAEHMHFTLEFLGEIQNDKIGLIRDAMEKISINPFTIQLSKIGYFKRKDGNIYWVGIKDEDALLKMQSQLHNELLNRDFLLETRKYTPHLTIGRKVIMNETFNPNNYLKSFEDLKININKIDLMKSENLKGKLHYSTIYTKFI